MVNVHGLEQILTEHPFFQGFSPAHLALLAGCAKNERFEAGDYLFREGEEATRFFLIRAGSVAIEVHVPGREPLMVETLGEGDIAGWSWIVPPYRWMFDARARSLTRVVSLDGKCLLGKCDRDHELGYQLFKHFTPVIAHRLSAARMQIMDMYGEPAKPAAKPSARSGA